MYSIQNHLIYNAKTKTGSSSLSCYVLGFTFDTNHYLAIFTIKLLDTTISSIKIPVNKLGMPIIAQLINAYPDQPTSIESENKRIYITQNGLSVPQVPFQNQDQYRFMVDMLQYSYASNQV